MKKALLLVSIFALAIFLAWLFPVVSMTVSAQAADGDLQMIKSGFPSTVIAGKLLTYTLTVSNLGTAAANGVVITDTLPALVTLDPSPTGCQIIDGGGKVRCNLGNLPGLESVPTIIRVRVNPSARTSLQNSAIVSWHDIDPDLSNNTDTVTTNVSASASLAVSKSDGLTTVTAGDPTVHTYTILVTNAGPSDASNVSIADTWPTGFTRGTVSPSAGGICDTSNPANFTCTYTSIPAAGSATITVNYTVPSSTPAGTQTNNVVVSSDVGSPVSTSDGTMVSRSAVLGIAKSDGLTQVTAGDPTVHSYSITVTNPGPSSANSVVVTDTWPTGFTLGTVTRSQGGGTCPTITASGFTCPLGSILVGGQATITANYTVPASTSAGPQTNSVVAGSDAGSSPSGSDNTTVVRSAALGIAKSDNLSTVTAGDGVSHRYAITVTNTGISDASSVVVTDTWPTGFTRGTTSPSGGGSCSSISVPFGFRCTFTSIPKGGQATITANYSVPASTPVGNKTNSVLVRSPDASLSATASDVTTVSTRANIGISVVDQPDPVEYTRWLTYTLTVANQGPSDASGVIVTDTLPIGTTFNSAIPSAGCNGSALSRTVTCNWGTLASGAQRHVHIKVYVGLSVAGNIATTATVKTGTFEQEQDLTNNTDQELTSVWPITLSVNWVSPMQDDLAPYYIGCQIVHLQANVTANVGVQRLLFYRWDHIHNPPIYVDIGSDFSTPYQWDLYTCDLGSGYNQLFVKAYDIYGNVSERKRLLLFKPGPFLPSIMRR